MVETITDDVRNLCLVLSDTEFYFELEKRGGKKFSGGVSGKVFSEVAFLRFISKNRDSSSIAGTFS